MPVAGVDDLQRPPPLRLFAPEVHAEERPVVEVGRDHVSRPLEEQRGRRPHGRRQQYAQVSPRKETQRNLTLDVLEEFHLVQGAPARVHVHVQTQRELVRRVDLAILYEFLRLADVLWGNRGPSLGQVHQRCGVHQTVPELVTNFPLHA